jgi:hypothetical protein
MLVFTKCDLKRLYEEEVIIQQNKYITLIVQHMKQLVISKAKEGNTSVTYKHTDIFSYYNDEWVKNQILSDLKRIFTDSDIVVNSNGLDSPTITVSIDWS